MTTQITQYGFCVNNPNYEVIRLYHHKNYESLSVKTDKETLKITITPKGYIRCYKEDKNGKLMKGEIR